GKPLGPERGRTIALIPETPEVYPTLTVWEHLAFVARATRRPAGWEARADALLARFGLAGRRDALGETLSKGLRQKTLIAATVIAETPVLLIDEPMVGLDPLGQRELRELFLELRASGVAIVMSTHLIEQAESLCDRLVILCNGTAVANGTIEELRAAATGHSLEDIFLELTGSR
ncbi:MAG: ABC transporter ATP-binding protein, partial [Vulcanimicrobiaceae bacterium]